MRGMAASADRVSIRLAASRDGIDFPRRLEHQVVAGVSTPTPRYQLLQLSPVSVGSAGGARRLVGGGGGGIPMFVSGATTFGSLLYPL